jgi:ABC-type uncharacterized transport system permease subunit
LVGWIWVSLKCEQILEGWGITLNNLGLEIDWFQSLFSFFSKTCKKELSNDKIKLKLINNTTYRGQIVTQTLHTGYGIEKKFNKFDFFLFIFSGKAHYPKHRRGVCDFLPQNRSSIPVSFADLQF